MKRFVSIIGLVVILLDGGTAFARSGGGSHSSGGSIQVHGYTRKDGTYVAPYHRHLSAGVNRSATETVISPRHQARIYSAHISSGFVGARDEHGRIIRSEAAKREFMRVTGYPHGRPGYVVDHIIALKRGGPDVPSNMQWQTIEEAKAKDRWE